MKPLLIVYFLAQSFIGWSQNFPAPGQLASTAFPVCATQVFKQTTVPGGHTSDLNVPGCGIYQDIGPFWYSFTCYESGTLGFTITPNILADDYDWMLFDYTGHNPNDVYKDVSLILRANWSGSPGATGAKKGGSLKNECASDPDKEHIPTFSSMPTLIRGHEYLLLVSHYTKSQSGYSLSFEGGTAVIKDPMLPDITAVSPACDRKSLTISLNKQMRCASLAPNGSDFMLSPGPVTITGASGTECSSGFDMTTVRLTLSGELPAGNYSIITQNGDDGNTLLDDCGSPVDVGKGIDFEILPPHPTPLDSLENPECAAQTLRLVFSDPIQCSSIAKDGSDFSITGNSMVEISGAEGNCVDGTTKTITVTLQSPIVVGGNYQISLLRGSDGNTIINECGAESAAGASVAFITKDTVSASFSYDIGYGCKFDMIEFHYDPANGVTHWEWFIDSTSVSTLEDPSMAETVFGPRYVQHIVSNDFCSDTVSEIVLLDNVLIASFQAADIVCPKDLLTFTNTSIGHIVSWNWDFGDGVMDEQQTPAAHLFPNTATGRSYTVSLIVKDNLGCTDTTSKQVTKLQSCYITVPNAFTPDGNGINDYLYPLNAYMATNLQFIVYNRYGQIVFESRDWTKKWDGTINGKKQDTGTFLWTLRYTDGPSGQNFFLRGTSVLIR